MEVYSVAGQSVNARYSAVPATELTIAYPGLPGGGMLGCLAGQSEADVMSLAIAPIHEPDPERTKAGSVNRLASFDIFDTTLTRLVGSPHAVFLLLGYQLRSRGLTDLDPFVFMRRRVLAEHYSRRRRPSREVTLDEIYQVLGNWLDLSDERREAVKTLECKLESDVLRAVPGAHQRIKQERASGKRIVFTSDMYLPSAFLKEQLSFRGLWSEGDRCYVSAEHDGSKVDGTLFETIIERESVSSGDIIHWGDNPVSDVRGAHLAGVAVEHYADGLLNRYERTLERYSRETTGLTSLMAGASRLARMTLSDSGPHERAIAAVSAGVAGPALAAFVIWMLLRARERGLKRLYFVSRDGQILLDIASRLAPVLGLDIELRYLYGSRQAWHLPGIYDEIDSRHEQWIFDPGRDFTVRTVLRRVELDPEDVSTELRQAGFDEKNWDRHLTEADVSALKRLMNGSSVRARIFEKASAARKLTIDYLRQEGLFDEVPAGIVDLGWRGRVFTSLHAMMRREGGKMPVPYFFGLSGGTDSDALSDREVFLFDLERGQGADVHREVAGIENLLEAFCSGCDGKTIGYTRDGSTVRPTEDIPENKSVMDWGLPVHRQAVHEFTERLEEGLALQIVEVSSDALAVVGSLLQEVWLRPTTAEAEAWGSFPYEDAQAGTEWEQLARPIQFRNIGMALYNVQEWDRQRPIWLNGSIQLSSRPTRAVLSALLATRPIWSGLRRRILRRS